MVWVSLVDSSAPVLEKKIWLLKGNLQRPPSTWDRYRSHSRIPWTWEGEASLLGGLGGRNPLRNSLFWTAFSHIFFPHRHNYMIFPGFRIYIWAKFPIMTIIPKTWMFRGFERDTSLTVYYTTRANRGTWSMANGFKRKEASRTQSLGKLPHLSGRVKFEVQSYHIPSGKKKHDNRKPIIWRCNSY